MYKKLNAKKVIATVKKLKIRIDERFPGSSIAHVCHELLTTATEAQQRMLRFSVPNAWIRMGVITVILAFFSALFYTLSIADWKFGTPKLTDIIQITEALINDVLLVGAALFFLITFEKRMKQQKIMKELHLFRSIAHVIDMHQLTKDPSIVVTELEPTEHSPERNMTEFELLRYLDYCSEMFSLIGKITAMFSERFPEPAIVSAANDIENLCNGLSKKVWQKMVFLGK